MCDSLVSINLPAGLTGIEEGAFFSCDRLKSVNIPDSVTSIGKNAFSRCCSLESVVIPDSVTSIGDGAFSRCHNFFTISIPEGVTSIGEGAFDGGPMSRAINMQPLIPPKLGGNLWSSYGAYPAYICVPAVAVDTYKSAKGWHHYRERIMSVNDVEYFR
jgi:hypothetical protein